MFSILISLLLNITTLIIIFLFVVPFKSISLKSKSILNIKQKNIKQKIKIKTQKYPISGNISFTVEFIISNENVSKKDFNQQLNSHLLSIKNKLQQKIRSNISFFNSKTLTNKIYENIVSNQEEFVDDILDKYHTFNWNYEIDDLNIKNLSHIQIVITYNPHQKMIKFIINFVSDKE